ncbi:MAG: hypothetical protein LBB43_06785 [Spirochaetaceae bacterium]|nr:hypothetical protein [Spirochaetaceae bacterium]
MKYGVIHTARITLNPDAAKALVVLVVHVPILSPDMAVVLRVVAVHTSILLLDAVVVAGRTNDACS